MTVSEIKKDSFHMCFMSQWLKLEKADNTGRVFIWHTNITHFEDNRDGGCLIKLGSENIISDQYLVKESSDDIYNLIATAYRNREKI